MMVCSPIKIRNKLIPRNKLASFDSGPHHNTDKGLALAAKPYFLYRPGAVADPSPEVVSVRLRLAKKSSLLICPSQDHRFRSSVMAFQLEQVVPWGRSFDEYASMFALSGADLDKTILGCGDGPASFNAELTVRGGRVNSADPVYRFSAGEIALRIEETCTVVLEQTRRNADEFLWQRIRSVEELGRVRMIAMRRFLQDYPRGRQEGRYVDTALPSLQFADKSFELALCSHFLFLYSGHFDGSFHLRSLRELCRVAEEVRVFPLLEFGAVKSRHLDEALSQLSLDGHQTDIVKVSYEFQRGANEMLVVH